MSEPARYDVVEGVEVFVGTNGLGASIDFFNFADTSLCSRLTTSRRSFSVEEYCPLRVETVSDFPRRSFLACLSQKVLRNGPRSIICVR